MLESVRESEIRDDNIPVAIQEEVLQLEIPMDDFLFVDVPDAGDELREELAGVLFIEIAVREDVVEELATGCVLENDADVLVCLDDIV